MSVPGQLPMFADTLADARDELREQLRKGEAVPCPCCTQLCKVYKRTVHAKMARSLILTYRAGMGGALDWVHLPTQVKDRARDDGMLAYWGLMEDSQERREDGGKAGWWRVTEKGERFIMGWESIPKYAHVYDGRVLDYSGPMVRIRQALGDKFDYNELMNR